MAFRQCFGDVEVAPIAKTEFLNSADYVSDKQLLQTLAYLDAASTKLSSDSKVFVTLSLESVIKTHGDKSEALAEAKKLVSKTIANLNTAAQKASKNVLVVAVASQEQGATRQKRETSQPGVSIYLDN